MGFLYFILGLMAGGTLGVITMCLFQINKKEDKEDDCQKNGRIN